MKEAGASDDEIKQAFSDALFVRDNAKKIMESYGLKHLGIMKHKGDYVCTKATTRIKELVSIAAAFSVNCTSNLQKHVAAAHSIGIREDEIEAILDAALFIKGEAAHYASQIVHLKEKNVQLQQLLDELQQTQAQLIQSEKMAALGKLVASVVHELNTPIGAMNSATDVLMRSVSNILTTLESSQTLNEVQNSKQFQNSLQALQNNNQVTKTASERISRLVSNLKSFARLDEAPFQKTDLHHSLESTLTLLEPDQKKRITVLKEYGDIPEINCYPADLNQVFMNLLTNAVQAIKENGTITIRTFLQEENVHIEFHDTGTGICPEKMKELFDPGFTKKGSSVRAGLGLFTSYNIVKNHLGQIKVKSEIDKGSTFTVILPTELKKQSKTIEVSESVTTSSRCDRLNT